MFYLVSNFCMSQTGRPSVALTIGVIEHPVLSTQWVTVVVRALDCTTNIVVNTTKL
jgi:hypothetical protein